MRLIALKNNDIVDVIAPASQCDPRELRAGLEAIRELGLRPRVARNLFGKSELFSNADKVRLAQLKAAIYNPDSPLIWCVRGGYGAIRLMPQVTKWPKPRRGKILLGYSDITSLHVHVNQKWGWPSIHGPLIDRLGRGDMAARERKSLLDMLFGRATHVTFGNLRPLNARARQMSTVQAPVVGGNMMVLQSALGTKSALNPRGKILFFEEIGERPHRMDRMLTQFAQNGWFQGARAVVFGHITIADARDRRIIWNDVIARFAKDVKIPVLCGLPVGHSKKVQMPLPLNTTALLTSSRLVVDSGIRP